MACRRVTAVARAAPLEDASPGSRLPSMRLQSGASENCQAGFRGGPSPGEGVAFLWAWAAHTVAEPGPGLLRNSGNTLSASVTVCCLRSVTVVPAWWGVGNGVRSTWNRFWHSSAERVVVLSLGIVLSWGPTELPVERWACCRACRESRALARHTTGSPETSACRGRAPGLWGHTFGDH